jgi:hypothetical protein
LLITAVNHDVYIFLRELALDRSTDAGGAAGHERPLAGQAKIHERSLSNDLDVERRFVSTRYALTGKRLASTR